MNNGQTVEETTVDRVLSLAGCDPNGSDPSPAGQPPNLRAAIEKLQAELSQWTLVPTTPAEIRAYDEGLQLAAVEKLPQVVQTEAFLAELEKLPILKADLAIQKQMTMAVGFLAGIGSNPALTEYVRKAKLFLGLDKVSSFSVLREKLEELVEEKLTFRARRDPRRELSKEAVVLGKNEEEALYLPHGDSLISQRMWSHVTDAYKRANKASTDRGKIIRLERDAFRKKATPGLTPYRAVNEKQNGLFLLPISFKDKKYERKWQGELLIAVNNGNFSVSEAFGPDRLEFIKKEAVWSDSEKLRWFPLDPEKFKSNKAPWSIREIVWPAIKSWYEDEERRIKATEEDQAVIAQSRGIQAKSEISAAELLAGKPGFCGVFIRDARTNQYGPDDLTFALRGTGNTFFLEEYISRRGVFNFKNSLGKEIPIEEKKPEPNHQTIQTPEETILFNQARIIRGFLRNVASRQRPANANGNTFTPPPQPEEEEKQTQ